MCGKSATTLRFSPSALVRFALAVAGAFAWSNCIAE
jgi:hypothetical protein